MSCYMNANKLIRGEVNELKKWYFNDNKILNLICEPYQKMSSLYRFIQELLKENKLKVLYINKEKKIINELKCNSDVEYILFSQIYSIGNKFYDLIIYDDITYYSKKILVEFREELIFLLKRTKKIIFCSAYEIFNNVQLLETINFNRKENFIEPRIIETRLNLKKAMPYLLYDYLKWFIKEERLLVIYTPTIELKNCIFNYYTNKLNLTNEVHIIQSNKDELLKDIEKFKYRGKNCFIITNELEVYLDKIKDVDIMFYFSEHNQFDFKKILYTCGILTNNEKYKRELLLICNKENNNIEKAKNIARRFNRIAWEKENKNL
ncbi:hypothetical protein [Clostridium tarantellae]|uniref:Comf operon protein A, DNA transporter ATPase n=1 Tax=Clostridium tarantellae TaxID=39493 RepID=A0A6I1MI30_9CLOT|nr:hypothetical protein [Clostridium tarantellae]MPQ42554.1 hypothetical protein [Clostridium tarantellae]